MSEHHWSFIIFMVEGKANHVAIGLPEIGVADLSLRGARVITWDDRSFPKGELCCFGFSVPDPEAGLAFLRQPGLLMGPIIAREKQQRGWHLTTDAPDYVRTFRNQRSRDPDNMNCVEWIVQAVEVAGLTLPEEILTPTDLLAWCRENLPEIPSPKVEPAS